MTDSIKLVEEFNDAFEINYKQVPTLEISEKTTKSKDLNFCIASLETCGQTLNIIASGLKPDESVLRLQLLTEELAELARGIQRRDLLEIYDALVDLQYVLDGTFLHFGLQDLKEAGLREVHRSNMSKLDKDGKPMKQPSGRVLKSPEYSPPDLKSILGA